MLVITPQGEQAVEKAFNLTTPRGSILSILYEIKSGAELEDIVQKLNTTDEKAAVLVRSLINDGLVEEK